MTVAFSADYSADVENKNHESDFFCDILHPFANNELTGKRRSHE